VDSVNRYIRHTAQLWRYLRNAKPTLYVNIQPQSDEVVIYKVILGLFPQSVIQDQNQHMGLHNGFATLAALHLLTKFPSLDTRDFKQAVDESRLIEVLSEPYYFDIQEISKATKMRTERKEYGLIIKPNAGTDVLNETGLEGFVDHFNELKQKRLFKGVTVDYNRPTPNS